MARHLPLTDIAEHWVLLYRERFPRHQPRWRSAWWRDAYALDCANHPSDISRADFMDACKKAWAFYPVAQA